MEASFLEDFDCGTKTLGFATKPADSPIELDSIKLAVADDKQEHKNCEHFTIRGYVAEVRKSDAKIGWPFPCLDKHKSKEHVYSLPPLSVTRFRWWKCHDCVHNSLHTDLAITNGVVMSVENGDLQQPNLSSEENANVASDHSGLKKPPEEKGLEGRSTNVNHSSVLSCGKLHSPLYSRKKENAFASIEFTEEGFPMPSGVFGDSQENQSLCRKPTILSTERKRRVETENQKVQSSRNSKTVCHGEDASDMTRSEAEIYDLVNGVSGFEMSREMPITLSNNIVMPSYEAGRALRSIENRKEPCDNAAKKHFIEPEVILKDGILTDIPAHILDDCDASDIDKNLINHLLESKSDATRSTGDANLHHKKARKVRLLNDIMRSEESHVASKVCSHNVDEKVTEIDNCNSKSSDTLKVKQTGLYHGGHSGTKKIKIKPARSHNKNEALNNEDEGPSLMHWLQKLCKKTLTHKRDKASRKIIDAVAVPNFSVDAASWFHDVESYGEKQKFIVDRKQVEAGQLCHIQENRDGKCLMTAEDKSGKEHHSVIRPKLAAAGIPEKDSNFHHKILSDTHRKVILKKGKRKAPGGNDDCNSQKHSPKDSSGEHDHKVNNNLQWKKKVLKNQKQAQECAHGAVDDFPMDIVELLARNQHERCMMSDEVAARKLHNLSEMAEKMKNDKVLDNLREYGNKLSHPLHENLHPQQIQFDVTENDVHAPVGIDLNVDCTMKSYHSLGKAKCGLETASTVSIAPSQSFCPLNEMQLPVYSQINYLPQNFFRRKMDLQSSLACQTYSTGPDNHPCRNTHYMPSVIINSSIHASSTGKGNADFSQEPCYSLSEDHRNAAHKTAGIGSMKPADSFPQIKRQKVESPINGKTAHQTCGDPEPNSHSRLMMSLKEHSYGTRSEMLSLRPMEFSGPSSGPLFMPPVLNQQDFPQELRCQCDGCFRELYASPNGHQISNVNLHPWISGYPDQDEQPKNSCRPIRPVPRMGKLGSLLHKEITMHSNSCTTLFGFKNGHSSELSSFKSNTKSKIEDSQLSPHSKTVNGQACIVRYENSEQAIASVKSLSRPGRTLERNDASSVEIENKDGAAQPLQCSYGVPVCAVNRNPADFACPDEDSEYMVDSVRLRPRDTPLSEGVPCAVDVNGLKRRKVMKLAALKALMRS